MMHHLLIDFHLLCILLYIQNLALNMRRFGLSIFFYVPIMHEGEFPCESSFSTGREPRVSSSDGMKVIEFIERCYAEKRRRPCLANAPTTN